MLIGIAIFTIQIVAEIIKRVAAIAGRPITTAAVVDDHGV